MLPTQTYMAARERLRHGAAQLRLPVHAHELPGHRGAQGEALGMDTVLCGPAGADRLVVVTSGVHGVEGLCGSAVQAALLHDPDLQDRLHQGRVALLLVHAVNPHGFSYQRRVNEDGVDLNRNFLDFSQPLPANAGYAALHGLLLPPQWPPGPDNRAALDGQADWLRTTMRGQASHADGLFFTGLRPAWSNTTLRAVLREQGRARQRISWIDIHSGLGPFGHGEKIFAGRGQPGELERARACWGADVFSPLQGQSVSQALQGTAASAIYDECAGATVDCMALEFGTVPAADMLDALRADHWLALHPDAAPALAAQVRHAMFNAFCSENPLWQGMVLGQARTAVVQAVAALAA